MAEELQRQMDTVFDMEVGFPRSEFSSKLTHRCSKTVTISLLSWWPLFTKFKLSGQHSAMWIGFIITNLKISA